MYFVTKHNESASKIVGQSKGLIQDKLCQGKREGGRSTRGMKSPSFGLALGKARLARVH